ncbi:MAG: sn-glycerol-1-phosphate dehydrogenase [Lachnospiraceae bacterium]|nr:sn-glycerol-1-phosphate dehydrogenase [Lachnospiraceae bacterium]
MLKENIFVGKGVLSQLPELVKKAGVRKAFVLADKHTYKAAGEQVCRLLTEAGIGYSKYIIEEDMPEPDEHTVGSVIMHFDTSCDLVIGVGSGVINDVSKILSNVSKSLYYIVATAPSMDGYASATSSMSRDGLKISLPSKCADVIFGDTDILKTAPDRMLLAGLGDMLAKYVSICDWRIAHVITGEYYSEEIAQMVRESLKKCVDNAYALLKREDEAVEAVFMGLINTGLAMALAGVSRPASGVEHYLSHTWDMRALEFGTGADLHGIQCGVGTLIAVKLFEKLRQTKPDREKALAYVAAFSYEEWSRTLRKFLGKGAEAMIELEEKEQKYSVEKHKKRLEIILEHWNEICRIMDEELPASEELETLMKSVGAPVTAEEIGQDEALAAVTFQATKDIRDKYVLSRLVWDLGVIDEVII